MTSFNRNALSLALSAAAATLAGIPPALAQVQGIGQGAKLEEVVITARKIEENLQDAPLSVTTFESDGLIRAGLRDIAELSLFTPGFSMQNNSRANEQPFIRGMVANSVFREDQTASSFIDGMFVIGMGRTVDLNTELERVEIIKGPQAAMFGRSTFAGAINYITRTPSDEPELDIVLTAGENGRYESSLWASAPLIEGVLRGGINLRYNEYEGAFEDLSSGDPIGGQETTSASVKLVFTPSENLSASFRYADTSLDDEHSPGVILGQDILNINAGGVRDMYDGTLPIPDRDSVDITTENVDGGFRKVDQERAHLVVDWQLGNLTLTSMTHYAEETLNYYIDGDLTQASPFGGFVESWFNEDYEDFSQELRLTSDTDARFRWMAGLYYYEGEQIFDQLAPPFVPGDPRKIENYSAFASLEYDINEQWTVTVDGRAQNETITRERAGTGEEFRKADTDALLPRVIVHYRPSDDLMWYASASKGNQPADFNTGANVPAEFENIDEQDLWSYETGVKADFADGRYRLNAAVFFLDWTGQGSRFTAFADDGTPTQVTVNAGQTEIYGLEATFQAAITESLSLTATYARIDAEYKRFESQNCLLALGDANCDGKKLQNVPETQASLSVSYERPVFGDYLGFARSDIAYRSEQYVDEMNFAEAPNVVLVNASMGIRSDRLELMLWARNLLDEESPDFATRFVDLGSFPFNTGYQLALRPPREFGVTARFNF